MQRSKLSYVIFLVIILALFLPISALADAAPPGVPDGENINPGDETTMVQMVAEEVIIDVGLAQGKIYVDDVNYLGGYIVAYNCTFWLENKGTETENLAVRFPINNDYEYGKINIHSIKVNGQPVSWVEDEIGDRLTLERFNWAHFDVVFPPGEEVEVKVTYTSVSYGWYGASHHRVSYILETGAGWYGPIQKGKIILRFPYKATSENVILAYTKTTEGIFTDSDVYWEFTDLEPTSEDNWEVQIVAPDLWLEILAERKRLESSPNNFSALYRLAEYINEATIYKGFEIYSTSLYEEGLETIKNAVRLNPNDVESHNLYTLYLRPYCTEENALQILEEVDIILELDPEYYSAQYRREEALGCLDRYATATPPSRPIPTEATKLNTPTPLREPEQKSSPTIIPTQLDTPDVEEEYLTSSTDNSLSLSLISILAILLLLGGMAVIRIINRK